MTTIEEVLKEYYPTLSGYEISELKHRLISFYTCCAKIVIDDLKNRYATIPENSSNNV